MAMTEWLQQQLIKEDIVTLKQQTISTLVDQLRLPSYKNRTLGHFSIFRIFPTRDGGFFKGAQTMKCRL